MAATLSHLSLPSLFFCSSLGTDAADISSITGPNGGRVRLCKQKVVLIYSVSHDRLIGLHLKATEGTKP